jgi:hypothetical protein
MTAKPPTTSRKVANIRPKSSPQKQPSIEFQISPPYLIIAAIVLIIVAVVAWLRPRAAGDFFIALAGGRDVLAGHLGKPDTWAFTTQGHIWLNQNWGADLIFYFINQSFKSFGLLLLKAILISGCAVFMVLCALKRRVPLVIATIAAGVMLLASCYYMELRPYLFTLMCAPLLLWLLYLTLQKPSYIWFAVALILFWTNLHGGFIYGLGMIWLWAFCLILPAVLEDGAQGVNKYWQVAAGALAATLLAGFANPFGLKNLSHPFLIATSKSWQLAITEWKPLWDDLGFDGVREFIIVISLLAVLFILRQIILRLQAAKRGSKTKLGPAQISVIVFETGLTFVSVIMAVQSRRFIPLALLIIAPVFAMHLWWLVRSIRRQWLIAVLSGIILIYGAFHLYFICRYYAPDNPTLTRDEPFINKMHFVGNNFPLDLTQFVNNNNIKGNVLCDWVWEGFLHWYSPGLKMFIGSRAQQVYDKKLLTVQDDIIFGPSPAKLLKDNGVSILALPYLPLYQNLISKVTGDGAWVFVYADGKNFLLVDAGLPENAKIIDQLLHNQLIFIDQATALMSKAVCMLSPAVKAERLEAARTLDAALRISPSSYGYGVLAQIPYYDATAASEVIKMLQSDLGWLESLGYKSFGGDEILQSRYTIASALADIYQKAGMEEQANIFKEAMQKALSLHRGI